MCYIRYLVFQKCKDNRDYYLRFQEAFIIASEEKYLKEVFSLYALNFEDKNNACFDTLSGAYFREFKKAYYAMML